MSFDIVSAITDNMRGVLRARGVRFSHRSFNEAKEIPASQMPSGQISYAGEAFAGSHGERPSYSEAEFDIKVLMLEKDTEKAVREQQRWAHEIREALTVNALNAGPLAAAKPVSRVTIAGALAESHKDNIFSLSCKVSVRYREA
ncbi:MAG: hypothetical protein HY893_03615 [Deltaproteobacteria bacterium]|nr:hypothetical protein [Deltaproteobacteria bacterium]